MIRICTTGGLLYDPRLADPIHRLYLSGAKMDLALNKAGSLTVTVPEQNPQYGTLKAPTSEIWVLQDGVEIFRGRVREVHEDLDGLQEIVAEGLKACLRDEQLRPYKKDTYGSTVAGWLAMAVNTYNTQRQGRDFVPFAVGTVESQSLEIEDKDYKNILDAIDNDLIKAVGGYLYVDRVGGENVIRWSLASGPISEQRIAYGVNLTGYKRDDSAGALFTAVIPLGKSDGDNGKLTVKTVNGGSDVLVDATAAARDGLIVKVVDHSDIEDAQALKDAGLEDLAGAGRQAVSVEATAVDLADAGVDVGRLRLGHRNPVQITRGGPEQLLPIDKISVDLIDPGSGRYTFSQEYQTLTQQQRSTARTAATAAERSAEAATPQSVAQQIRQSEAKYVDWVAATGTTDGWSWRRWSSGAVEAWTVRSVTVGAAAPYGSALEAAEGSVTLPVSVQAGAALTATVSDSSPAIVCAVRQTGATAATVSIAAPTVSATYTVAFYLRGMTALI